MEKYYVQSKLPKQIQRLLRLICSKLYIQTNHDLKNSILIAGSGRSGTTWLSELINSQIPSRLMFEPFHFDRVLGETEYHLFHYMRPSDKDDVLYQYAQQVFTGRLRNSWVDWQNKQLLVQFRIIKEIRANLFLKWLHRKFPEIPFFYIIRHPCAVVLSRKEMMWATDSDIEPFLRQELLITDHLTKKIDVIKQAQTDIEKHAVIWCITNLIPLNQIVTGEITPIFYENLCTQPEIELSKVYGVLGRRYNHNEATIAKKPSVTSSVTSAVVTGEDRVTRWKDHLTTGEIDQVLNIVQAFGLDYLYGDSHLPLGFPFRM